jgi:hypothetical protein
MKRVLASAVFSLLISAFTQFAFSQSLGNAGTIEGTVVDQSGAAFPKAAITIRNPVSGYSQTTTSGSDGTFRLSNIPPNPYHMEVTASGFRTFAEDVTIRGSIPVQVKATLTVGASREVITVEAAGAHILEVDPSSHVDVDKTLIDKIPTVAPAGGLTEAITWASGGVAADANGLLHPVGDHSQTSFMIDGQPISDQQSKVFSTQLPTSAIQSMEIVTGTPDAELGDKTSLVANITTRSGLGAGRVFGNLDATYGSFGSAGGSAALGFGNSRAGNLLAVDGVRSGRFLDAPEFTVFHGIGNNQSIFDRFDYQPGAHDSLHLNLFAARNWIQIPNTYDTLGQDQRQRVMTWSIAPGYQHTFGANTLLSINPYIRKDNFYYYGSRDPFADTPSTQSQARQLLNWGVKTDLAVNRGRHDLKFGMDIKQTRLAENFGFGITDFGFNPVCLDRTSDAAGSPDLTDPSQCARAGLQPNPDVSLGLIPFDLTRGGSQFFFRGTHNINQYAFFGQDSIKAGNFLFKIGFRGEHYDGVATASGAEPRAGIAYSIKKTGTVLRVAYARTFETPFNENLLLSSAAGVGGLAENVFGADAVPIRPGRRNQFNTGLQQAIGRYMLVDIDYFWKYTNSAYDYSVLLNTTITFPISWHNSKLDGVTGRVSTVNLRGFQGYWTFGHTRARYFPPEVGGLISQGADLGGGVFRIDHDQAFQSTAMFRYQLKKAEWVAFAWRYDSGLVVSGVPDSDAALALTPNQQATVGLSCRNQAATFDNRGLTPELCGTNPVISKLISLPQAGEGDDDHNPARVKSRHLFNLGLGTDNLFHTEKRTKVTAGVNIANLTNKAALYNFLSTFSGTHFVQPRTVVARIGLVF